MILSKKQWELFQPNTNKMTELQQAFSISSVAAKILIAKGYDSVDKAQSILTMSDAHLHDPFLMHGMEEAVARIEEAVFNEEKILIYGDYDSDGITSTAIMMNVLLDLGADVQYMIPNRFDHGYGPNMELFEKAHAKGIQLIITVDNGISGIEPIRRAKELGMDVIITDHHEAGKELPVADIILHPRVPEGQYPFPDLAGVGVAFKLAHALYGEVPDHLYELVAIGTVADLVPLVGENRYLVKQGIAALKRSNSLWVRALCDVCGTKQSAINEEVIGFYFCPRLNAVGRLGNADPGVQFILSDASTEVLQLANMLNDKNSERKEIVQTITDEAIAQIGSSPIHASSEVLIVTGEGWNAGVVGIVASRLVEKYHKPTFVLAIDHEKGIAKGSARSIEGFHLYEEIAKNHDIVPHFGGHPMAAGMTMPLEHVDELRKRLHEQAGQVLTAEQRIPKLHIDVPIELAEITVEAIEELDRLRPFGVEFTKPLFCVSNVAFQNMRKIGAQENHLKAELTDGILAVDAIGFSKGLLFNEISYGVKASIVGDLQVNEWQGNKKPQFMIQDVQINEWQLFDMRGKSQVANWLAKVNIEDTSFIAFREETIRLYEHNIPVPIIAFQKEQQLPNLKGSICILDLPENVTFLENLLQAKPFERIYAHLYVQNSQYFNGMPTREHFGWYYSFLKKRQTFNLKQHIQQLSEHIGLNIDVINFMSKVFLELGFVTIENGVITVMPNVEKRALTDAPSYKMREQQLQLEQTLVYATYNELKQWFHERMKHA